MLDFVRQMMRGDILAAFFDFSRAHAGAEPRDFPKQDIKRIWDDPASKEKYAKAKA